MNKNRNLFEHLTTFLGILFVISGVMGLLIFQGPLSETQDTRSRAIQQEKTPKLYPVDLNKVFYTQEVGEITLVLDTGGIKPTRVRTAFNIINSDIEAPEVYVDAKSGFIAETLEVEKVDDGYLVYISARSREANIIFQTNTTELSTKPIPLIQISINPELEGVIGINFDEDLSYLETEVYKYKLQVTNGEYNIVSRNDNGDENGDDENEEELKEPEMPIPQQCDQECQSNADCDINLRCFNTGSNKVCRLATNVSDRACQPKSGQQQVSSPTTQQTASIVSNCRESCNTNADCDINLRCYHGECRLATNPSSLTCIAATTPTVSTIYGLTTESRTDDEQKGARFIPDEELELREVKNGDITATGATFEDDFASETLLELIQKMLKDNEQRLPILVIISGLILLVFSAILFAINKVRYKNNS